MKSNYYFLSAMLPELQIGSPPELSFAELEPLLATNLKAKDLAQVAVIRRLYDVENIRELWRERPLSPYGFYDESELEEALLTRAGLPEYIYDFMDRYPESSERLQRFGALLAAYFRVESAGKSDFLHRLLAFEREWRLVFVGFRAKALGRDLGVELQYEDPEDIIVAQMLAQKDAKSFEPPEQYEELKALFESKQDSPLELHQALCEYRFNKIAEMIDGETFSIDRILGYLCQLIIVEQWLELDKKKGLEIVDTIVRE